MRARGIERWQAWAIPLALVVLWEAATRSGALDTRFFVPLTEVAVTAVDFFVDADGVQHLSATLRRLLLSFSVAAVGGTLIGVASALWSSVALLVRPIADTLYPTPKIALLPLLIIIVGLGEGAYILTAFATAFFQIIIGVRASVHDIDPTLIEAGRNFGANGLRFFRRLLLPAMAPGLLNSLRLGMATCLITLVVVEFVSAEVGLGATIHRAGQQFAVDRIYAGIFLVGLLGHAINLAFRGLERVALPWQPAASRSVPAPTGGG